MSEKRTYVRRLPPAYVIKAIEKGSILSRGQLEVYRVLLAKGPMTSGELESAGVRLGAHRRLSELERRGVARRVESRVCSATGRKAQTWDVTEDLPKEPEDGPVRVRQALAVGADPWHAAASFARKLGLLPDHAEEAKQGGGEWALVLVTATGEKWKASGISLPGGCLMTKWA